VDFQAAAAFAEAAQAALARAGTPPDLRARLFRDEGRVRRHAGDPVIAFGFAELALMSYQRAYGEESPEVARSLGDLVGIMLALGAYRGALAVYARALPLLERTHGPNHPNVGAYLHNMAAAAFESGDLAGAADGFERAIAMAEQTYGAGQGGSRALLGLAQTREQQGRLEAARELALRALAVDEKLRRPDHPDLAWDHLTLCGLALDQGNLDEAQARCDKAVDIRVAAYGPDHPDVADVQVLRAQIARKRHDVEGARELIERALAVHRKALGARHPTVAADDSALAAVLLETGNARAALPLVEEALPVEENARYDDAAAVVTARTLLAEALLATGDPGRALAVAERAVAAATARRPRADIDGLARFAWAQALDATDRPRALRLAREARGLLVGSPAADQVARVDRWLGGR